MFDLFKRTRNGVEKSRATWFSKITSLFTRPAVDEQTWTDLEELLVSADVGIGTTAKLVNQTRQVARNARLSEGPQVYAAFKRAMTDLLATPGAGVLPEKTPAAAKRLIMVVGVNGAGKTTTIAKLARSYRSQGYRVILGAADTFRAAAIDQLRQWGENAGVDVIAHQPGSDPAAVVFDTIQAAQARNAQVVIVDTAGRLHTKYNLMEELKKIRRVSARWGADVDTEVLLTVDATTGQNGLAQAKSFTDAVGVTGIVLTKLDGTARGGIVLTIADELRIPIKYIGTGEQIDDLAPFDPATFVEAIFSESSRPE